MGNVVDITKKKLSPEAEKELQELYDREKSVFDRTAKLKSIHEDLIHIHRYGHIETLTFLALSEQALRQRRQSSWYGKIVKISEVDSGDSVREFKKKLLKIGDVVVFNPDSAYSLNIAGFEEIWIIHIDSVLDVDTDYDYMAAQKSNISQRHTAQAKIAEVQFKSIQQSGTAKKIEQNVNGSVTKK